MPNVIPRDGNYLPVSGDVYDPTSSGYAVAESGSVTTDTVTSIPYAPSVIQAAKYSVAVAAGSSTTAVVVKATPGYLGKILVTAVGTAAISIYDNASAASGKVIGYIAANTAAGTVTAFDMPAANGITAGQVNNSPAITISYS